MLGGGGGGSAVTTVVVAGGVGRSTVVWLRKLQAAKAPHRIDAITMAFIDYLPWSCFGGANVG